jgi:Zn-dependent peptidase ImmA (M78 family)
VKRSEIKRIADEFCAKNGIDSYPVGIVSICQDNGLKVFEEYLDPDISGLIVVDTEEWEKYDGATQFIVVNLTNSAARRRFTIAHELAHFVLHRNGAHLYAHRDSTVDGTPLSSIEQEANYFAANILMPEPLVREKVDLLKRDSWTNMPGFALVYEIACSFAVSESAAEVRLKQLKIL